jgi:hypothetical protein
MLRICPKAGESFIGSFSTQFVYVGFGCPKYSIFVGHFFLRASLTMPQTSASN